MAVLSIWCMYLPTNQQLDFISCQIRLCQELFLEGTKLFSAGKKFVHDSFIYKILLFSSIFIISVFILLYSQIFAEKIGTIRNNFKRNWYYQGQRFAFSERLNIKSISNESLNLYCLRKKKYCKNIIFMENIHIIYLRNFIVLR